MSNGSKHTHRRSPASLYTFPTQRATLQHTVYENPLPSLSLRFPSLFFSLPLYFPALLSSFSLPVSPVLSTLTSLCLSPFPCSPPTLCYSALLFTSPLYSLPSGLFSPLFFILPPSSLYTLLSSPPRYSFLLHSFVLSPLFCSLLLRCLSPLF